MSLPTLASALGAPSTTPAPALGEMPAPAVVGDAAVGASGGFAAALDDATTGLEALSASALDGALALLPGLPEPALPVAGAAPATPESETNAADLGLDAAAPAPGWPPPGLSSLFPAMPVLATTAGASAATSMASARGIALAALFPEGSSASAAEGALPAPAALSQAAQGVASAATALPAANPLGPDALAAALARQPAPLRLPVADDSETASLTALTETLGLERAPDAAPLAPNPQAPALHKLDLAAAFPAPVPLPSPRFAEEVGARLQWIAEQQGGEATLRISPDGLGPVEIRMKLDGDRVELGFTATQQDTRQALQDALPKLREMLAQQGLQLGHADVGQKHAQSSNEDAAKTAKGFAGDDEGDAIVLAAPRREATLVIGRTGRGVLDLYA